MTRHTHVSDAALADLAPADEIGTSDDEIVRCDCGTLHRVGDEYHAQVCEVAADE